MREHTWLQHRTACANQRSVRTSAARSSQVLFNDVDMIWVTNLATVLPRIWRGVELMTQLVCPAVLLSCAVSLPSDHRYA